MYGMGDEVAEWRENAIKLDGMATELKQVLEELAPYFCDGSNYFGCYTNSVNRLIDLMGWDEGCKKSEASLGSVEE